MYRGVVLCHRLIDGALWSSAPRPTCRKPSQGADDRAQDQHDDGPPEFTGVAAVGDERQPEPGEGDDNRTGEDRHEEPSLSPAFSRSIFRISFVLTPEALRAVTKSLERQLVLSCLGRKALLTLKGALLEFGGSFVADY